MKALAILALLLAPVPVHAQKTAKELAADCAAAGDTVGMTGDAKSLETNPAAQELFKSPAKNLMFGKCAGYIEGALDTWTMVYAMTEKTQLELTGKHSTLDLKDAFMAYLKDHPERGHLLASIVLISAWEEHKIIRRAPATKE